MASNYYCRQCNEDVKIYTRTYFTQRHVSYDTKEDHRRTKFYKRRTFSNYLLLHGSYFCQELVFNEFLILSTRYV